MSIQRVMSGGSPGVDLVGMFNAHVGLHDQRDANKQAAVAGVQRYDPSTPLSAALAHPTRWPAFLKANAPARGKSARRGESRANLARADRGDEAELPSWQRMESGDRLEGPIPGNNRLEVPVQAERVHGSRVAQQPGASSQANSRSVQQAFQERLGDVAAAAGKAIMERNRCCAWLFGQGGMPVTTAV